MPISIHQFEESDRLPRHETNAERVVRFLVVNRDMAYKASEISDATGVAENSIQPVLGRLREQGLVRHKKPYWAIGDLDRVREASLFHSTAAFLDHQLGDEDRSEWLAAAESSDEAEE